MKKYIKIIAILAVISMAFVVLGGALVTKTGSADGCGRSWPLCEGELVQLSDVTPEKLIEFAHRATTMIGSIFVVVLAIMSSIYIKRRETKLLASISVLFLIIQALMGAAAVMWGQNPYIMALHFGISMISFASVLLLALLVFEFDYKFDAKELVIGKKMKRNLYFLSFYTYFVIYSGALVRHEGAGLALPVWPFGNGGFISLETIQQLVQFGHRSLALILFVWICSTAYFAYKHYWNYRVIKYSMISLVVLLLMQITSGILTVATGLSLTFSLIHSLVITLIFGVLSYIMLLNSRSKSVEKMLDNKEMKRVG
ncbi:COX15/CtaA family protein [Metabacillus sediminilitoris]|uniref:Heme A synthase n=1 Tax=Metabacillus sediminilitoris TaxID=2567941 RepID=A0A4S4BVH1_9BACI|nr:heme A synthase [Metabacillus sediminilitoris]QGQ44983.1 heme A synthase [Metabacillus sediminilitoris]THF78616.1 heme A synthase [Metabacillus sediminilitoris]